MGAEVTFVVAVAFEAGASPHNSSCSHVIATSLTNCHVNRPLLPGRRTSTRSGRRLRAAPLASWIVMLPSVATPDILPGSQRPPSALRKRTGSPLVRRSCARISASNIAAAQPPMIRACSLRMPASQRS